MTLSLALLNSCQFKLLFIGPGLLNYKESHSNWKTLTAVFGSSIFHAARIELFYLGHRE